MVCTRTRLTVLLGYLLLCGQGCALQPPPISMVGTTIQVESREPLTIAVYPAMVLAGRGLQVTWRIEPDPENREFCIEFDGELPWRKWCETIPHNRRIWQQRVEPNEGRYMVVLTVTRSEGRVRRASTPVCVAGPETTCGPQEPVQEAPQ